MIFQITSTSFSDGEEMPIRLTCEGADESPQLAWRNVPLGTKSLAIIVDDPDAPDPAAPKMTWVHWVLFNIPTDVFELPEAASKKGLPAGIRQGMNDWKRFDYGGPCPPIGCHRYFFKIYALDCAIDLNQPSKSDLLREMKGHILAQAQLVGTFQKRKSR